MIAHKCVNITGYDPNFRMEQGYDIITIFTKSYTQIFSGNNGPIFIPQSTLTPAPSSLVGLTSPKFMYFKFTR